jgi:hypothetical protein
VGNSGGNLCFSFNGNISFIISLFIFIMNLASISENQDIEKRIAITPEIAKNISV